VRFWTAPVLLAALLAITLLAPGLVVVDPNAINLGRSLQPPGMSALLGTDQLGRDVMARVLSGGRTAVFTGLAAVSLSTGLALLVGVGSGFIGGQIDRVVTAVLDGLLTLPGLLVALAILGIFGTERVTLVLALVGTAWASEARVLRSVTRALGQEGFVEAARVSGASDLRVLCVHVLPSVWSACIVLASLALGEVLLVISGLSFLGIGAQPPDADWGTMLSDGRAVFTQAPWLMLAPGGCIVLFSTLANLAGDAVRDSADPSRNAR
jgi:peptide/nickel transport system permease protein